MSEDNTRETWLLCMTIVQGFNCFKPVNAVGDCKHEVILGRVNQLPQRRSVDLTCHHLEIIGQENTTMETCVVVERRPGQTREGNDLAAVNARQANL